MRNRFPVFFSSIPMVSFILMSSLHAGSFSGQTRVDATFNTSVANASSQYQSLPNSWELHRGRIRYETQPAQKGAKRWGIRMEFQMPEPDSQNLFKNAPVAAVSGNLIVSQAHVVYQRHRNEIRFGLIECPHLTPYYSDYSLGIQIPIGSLIGRSGYHVGGMMSFQEMKYSGQLAIWQQETHLTHPYQQFASFTPVSEIVTPSMLIGAVSPETNLNATEMTKSLPSTSFGDNTIPVAGGGRFNYMPIVKKNESLGISVGISTTPLSCPLIVGVLYQPYVAGQAATDTTSAVPAQGFYRLLAFQRVSQMEIDILKTYRNLRMLASFETQRLPIKSSASVLTNDTTGGTPVAPSSSSYIFEDTGRGFAFGVECGFLVYGEGYKINRLRNEVSGVKLRPGQQGLEVGVRWGMERATNMLALMSARGIDDFLSSQYANVSGAGRYVIDGVDSSNNSVFTASALDNFNENGPVYVTPITETVYSGFGFLGEKTITTSYVTRSQGLSLHLNYYPQENSIFRIQFSFSWNDKKVCGQDSTYQSSIHFYNTRGLLCSFETLF